MAGGISVHAVDVTRGLPAAGLKLMIFRLAGLADSPELLAAGSLTPQGTFDHPIVQGLVPGKTLTSGLYEAVFEIGEFYRQLDLVLPEPPFLDQVLYRFGIADLDQHYHLPLKFSPWGFSLFRGG